ncbi:efflux RND transporter periplasmic adaptor subunit [Tundrisphaera lichenicola]|uniref:efflux RND transporter periplasmic adaptor subunit n=1 Tax=Tundrisphaera lichenicola TaxID=2029860 RepID=UPI003EC0333C
MNPRKGGIERVTTQPGSVHSFERVELYAMVSGYLKSQSVDIGTRVRKGEVLAEIDVPREIRIAEDADAMVEQARAHARQMEAKVKAREAERDTVAASAKQIESDLDRLVAESRLAEGQYIRVKSLYERNAIDKKLVDEQQRDREATIAAERTGRLAILTAKARLAGAVAKVDQARADVAEALAAIGVSEARSARARVDLGYAKIIAPFDGVVTHRGFHPGAFVRSASVGAQPPLLTVLRTDKMRVIVKVPDRDVVLTDPGDPASVTIDGLDGREFRGSISRIGESEDSASRTMRVEIDLPNPEGLLRDGMYGRARISLEPLSGRLTVPSACILDRSGAGRGVVQVVRDGRVGRVEVGLGADDGTLVEVIEGLGPDDVVVRRTGTALEAGMRVVTGPAE